MLGASLGRLALGSAYPGCIHQQFRTCIHSFCRTVFSTSSLSRVTLLCRLVWLGKPRSCKMTIKQQKTTPGPACEHQRRREKGASMSQLYATLAYRAYGGQSALPKVGGDHKWHIRAGQRWGLLHLLSSSSGSQQKIQAQQQQRPPGKNYMNCTRS